MLDHQSLFVISATVVSFIFVMSVFAVAHTIKAVYEWVRVRR